MDIPIAGVEHIDHPQIVSGGYLDDFPQNMWKLCAWDDAVLRAVARAQPADGPKRLFAALPELHPLLGISGEADFAGVASFAERDDLVPLLIEAGFQTVHFEEQDCL